MAEIAGEMNKKNAQKCLNLELILPAWHFNFSYFFIDISRYRLEVSHGF